jgi:hypothetical protein
MGNVCCNTPTNIDNKLALAPYTHLKFEPDLEFVPALSESIGERIKELNAGRGEWLNTEPIQIDPLKHPKAQQKMPMK